MMEIQRNALTLNLFLQAHIKIYVKECVKEKNGKACYRIENVLVYDKRSQQWTSYLHAKNHEKFPEKMSVTS